jgi:hypothetical protein
MKVIVNRPLNFEPLVLVLTGLPRGADSQIELFWNDWTTARSSLAVCHCHNKYFAAEAIDPHTTKVSIEWTCTQCLPLLIDRLAQHFPPLAQLEIGVKSQEELQRPANLIRIDATNVELESGFKERVGPFCISQEEVTVSEFEHFVRATSYVTTAERSGRRASFRSNFGINEFAPAERQSMPATLVSYIDAVEYCRWANMRLPSETEVIAAALADSSTHDVVTDLLRGSLKALKEEGKIINNGSKITSTLASPDLVVIRQGPYPFLTTNWKQLVRRNRLLKPLDFFNDVTGFHVCKS